VLVATGIVGASPATAHFMGVGVDSVDCTVPFDCEIRWEDYSRYDGSREFGIGQWDRLGRVDIVPDSPLTVADLEFIDYRKCDVTWDAFWTRRGGADAIGFNPCNITSRKFSHAPDPKAVAVHEIGHALRLAHSQGSRWRLHSIMYCCPRCGPTSRPHAHDVSDYRAIW
jgi:hypothetical protein